MASQPPRPRQPVDDVLGAADPFAGGTEEVLSYLHGVAVANQSDDADTGPLMVPVAFAARVSNKDSQDPTLSIPRQLARCREALPPYCVIVAFFWDVESGRLDLDLRGHGDAHELFDVSVPRDGGIADLLDEARQPGRRFVAVVCESVDRLSRVTYFGTKIEYELEQSGVALLAADEGITAESLPSAAGKPARKRATPILTRRVKQAIAEWHVIDMLEKSWGGLMEHTEQGFNIGKPPYGYQVVVERHPVPAKAALGKVKRRLVRDPVRGPVVTQIFRWRVVERLSYDEIADRINLDPDRYPPPEPILGRGRRAIGAWTKGSVRDVLANPKYAGHMVYDRRKNPRRDRGVAGKVNPPSEWIWSSKPRHEPLTTKAMYDAGTPIGKSKKGSRTSDQPNSHPATTRTYRLRSFVICELCGRRLYGETRRIASGHSYYACEAIPAHHAGKDWFDTHPKSLWVREDKLLDLVRAFFARRVFGPDRAELLASEQGDEAAIEDGTAARAGALRGKIKELERQQANVVKELREYQAKGDDDLDQEWRTQLRDSFAEITNHRKALQTQLTEIAKTPHATATADPRLLDQLPIIDVDFSRLPEDLERELFGGFQLQVRYHQPSRRVTLRVTIDGEVIPQLAATGRAIMTARGLATRPTNAKSRPPRASAVGGRNGFSLAGRAPGANSIWDTSRAAWRVIGLGLPTTGHGRGAGPPPPHGGGTASVPRPARQRCWALLGNSSAGRSANRAAVGHLVGANTASRAWGPPDLDRPQWPHRTAPRRPDRSRTRASRAARRGSVQPDDLPRWPEAANSDPRPPTRCGGDGQRRPAAGDHRDRHDDRRLVAQPPARPTRVSNGPGVANRGRARSSRTHSGIGGTR